MLWIKAFHIIFMVTWFAGLFYLPRLFIYHHNASDEISLERFVIMERRLFAITTIGGALTVVFGLLLIWLLGGLDAALWRFGWWHVKLLLVASLIGYQVWCKRIMGQLAQGNSPHSDTWYRWFNEVPAIMLIGVVVMVVVRPF
ncbi:MAG: CopD family protein [Pseudomonadota bacterium]